MKSTERTELFRALRNYFNGEDFRELCFRLGVEFGNLPGYSSSDKKGIGYIGE
jgi:hypothetical protein